MVNPTDPSASPAVPEPQPDGSASVPPCPASHERWKLVSRRFANARISILSCMHCGWIDTEAAIESAAALAPPVPEPQPDLLQKFYDLTTRLISMAPTGRVDLGATQAYHDALLALTVFRDALRRDKTVIHDESFWGGLPHSAAPLQELIARWRANAEYLRKGGAKIGADTQEFCANELEAAALAPRTASPQELAEQIAERLFTNGSGQHAQRLVLTVDTPKPRDLGGWCQGAVVDRIVDALQSAPRTASPRCTPGTGHFMRYGDSRCECGEQQTYQSAPRTASPPPICNVDHPVGPVAYQCANCRAWVAPSHDALFVALRDLLDLIASEDLIDESVSYMRQARAALAQSASPRTAPAPPVCPTCGSPDRDLHPLTGRDDSEVSMCRDVWHKTTEQRTAPAPSAEPVGDLLAYGREEAHAALTRKDRDTYQFWQGWNAALERCVSLSSSPEADQEPK